MEEQKTDMLEKAFFLERFYNKYRRTIIATISAAVIGGASYFAYSKYQEMRLENANLAYYLYQKGIEKEKNLEIIKSNNQKLYEMVLFAEAMKNSDIEKLKSISKSENTILADMARYQIASLEEDEKKLKAYGYKENTIFKDMAVISSAYLLAKQGDSKEANNLLTLLEESSPVTTVAKYLSHFNIEINIAPVYDASRDEYKNIVDEWNE